MSYYINKLGKGMNPTILLPGKGKQLGWLSSLTLVWQSVQEKENSLHLKIGLVSHPAHSRGVG